MSYFKGKVLDVIAYTILCPLLAAWCGLALLFGAPVVILAWAFDRIDGIKERD